MPNRCTHYPGSDECPRRFGKLPIEKILTRDDEGLLDYVRKGDDPELYRLDDLQAELQALKDRLKTRGPHQGSAAAQISASTFPIVCKVPS
jgi:hypothetical protein